MDIFLTGGSGSAGATFIRRLVADGHTVRALARSDKAAQAVTAAGAVPVRGDLGDLGPGEGSPAWVGVLKEVDAVVHAAAYMAFWGPDQIFVERNLVPTRALYRAAVTAGVARFVLVSAASVSTGSNRAATVTEDTPNGKPNIAYSRVKLQTEQELLALPHDRTALVILRPPFVWGPGMANLEGIVDLVNSGQFSWIDHGRHLVDFVHVDNLAHAITLALTNGEHGLVSYITDDSPRSAREFFVPVLAARGADASKAGSYPLALASPVATVLDALARARHSTTPPPITPWVIAFLGRDRVYDITRARTHLGYQPIITVEQGIQQLAKTKSSKTTRA